ncbi:MAG: response regulator transcription factor [Chitinophagaceae bacterium]|nr:MAG: response regulator transcription factor [Chitinophagaceae bacterium]
MNFLIIDDHSMIRAGMNILISKEYPSAQFYEAANEKQACRFLGEKAFDLIIMDLNMPESDPVRLLQFIKTNQPKTPVLVLTMNEEKSFAGRFFKMGIKGYVNKSADNPVILEAIRVVLQNGMYMSQELKDSLLNSFVTQRTDNPFEALSDREFQVIRELLRGKSIAEIAEDQGINISTVSTYKGKACEKLGVKRNNFVELLSLAKTNGII